mmetsp:Transcript_2474/g.4516  ORF Transcript_2474/g.4516 Transcript_2474/m.4516 type:complete len:102 (+) Transcript_2474:562-867(+)
MVTMAYTVDSKMEILIAPVEWRFGAKPPILSKGVVAPVAWSPSNHAIPEHAAVHRREWVSFWASWSCGYMIVWSQDAEGVANLDQQLVTAALHPWVKDSLL